MADTTGISPFIYPLEQGLILDVSNFVIPPGAALVLQNFEPAVTGGYRRINGYKKWINFPVPFSGSSADPVLMSAIYGNEVIAARSAEVYRGGNGDTLLALDVDAVQTTLTVLDTTGFASSGTILINDEEITYDGTNTTQFLNCVRGANGTTAAAHSTDDRVQQMWTQIETGRTGAGKMDFEKINYSGTNLLVYADGVNSPSYWDGSTVTTISDVSIPDPKFVVSFKNSMFFAGMSATSSEVVFTAPLTVDDFTPANGAGSFTIDAPVTGMIVFREELYIFAAQRIYKLTGNTAADYVLQPVTREIGCRNHFTIREFAGDVVFLGPDGLRTIAGTERIGDVELGTVSRNVQQLFSGLRDVGQFDSYVVPNKTQYRIFFSSETRLRETTRGVIMVRKGDAYEFGTTKGIRTSCTDGDIIDTNQVVVHGDWDGFFYKDEEGYQFDDQPVLGVFRSPDITVGDPGIRKAFQRVILNYSPEGAIDTELQLLYDYEANNVPQPLPYTLSTATVIAQYGTATYGGGATYGGQADPLLRQPVEGSGFAIAIKIEDQSATPSYTLKGFQLEFTGAARR